MIEEINGDLNLSTIDRARYVYRNFVRNTFDIGRGPKTEMFRPDVKNVSALYCGQSPGRLLTEAYIADVLPKLLYNRVIDVLEVGCGSGSMADRIAGLGFRGRYGGVDIQDKFRRDRPSNFPFEVTFHLKDIHDFSPSEKVDLIISVSALEHIPNDSIAIRKFPLNMKSGGVEIHVVPSGASLAAYLLHGYRQYTPARIALKFGPQVKIIRLGGLGSYLLHLSFITLPDLIFRRSLRKAAPGVYRLLLLAALYIDKWLPICPTAYAVVRRY